MRRHCHTPRLPTMILYSLTLKKRRKLNRSQEDTAPTVPLGPGVNPVATLLDNVLGFLATNT